MGTIVPRKRQDGTTGYTAQIRMKRKGEIVHNETRTFSARKLAVAWLAKREAELNAPGGLEKSKAVDPTLSEVIQRYLDTSHKSPLGKGYFAVMAASSRVMDANIIMAAETLIRVSSPIFNRRLMVNTPIVCSTRHRLGRRTNPLANCGRFTTSTTRRSPLCTQSVNLVLYPPSTTIVSIQGHRRTSFRTRGSAPS